MEVFLPDCGDLESWTWEAYARPYDYVSIYIYIYLKGHFSLSHASVSLIVRGEDVMKQPFL